MDKSDYKLVMTKKGLGLAKRFDTVTDVFIVKNYYPKKKKSGINVGIELKDGTTIPLRSFSSKETAMDYAKKLKSVL
jgi:hypothetical protein